METNLRIAIGLPSTGNIRIETAICMQALVAKTTEYFKNNIDIAFVYAVGSYIHENRKIIAMCAQKEKASHLLYVDTDMTFSSDGLIRLLERNKPIVGTIYNRRQLPLSPIINCNPAKMKKDEIFECEGLGFGFMLIERQVFDKIDQPWFFYEDGGEGKKMLGEDMWFCRQALLKGIKVWCDPTLKLNHIGTTVY
ncbi:hypothetical protein LCGC14_0711570 [marine sediment metagenome]|uniref:Glycosyltransferase 2-like domain-containing protein n=1 Tax=marine sediment metagenome TaxID=412755 RepID=A0A0F9R0B7_9ZZZZ